MYTLKRTVQTVSITAIIFCVASTTALAGAYGFGGSVQHSTRHATGGHHATSHQVEVHHNNRAGQHQRNNQAKARVQTSHNGASARVNTSAHSQSRDSRHHHGFSF